MEINLIKHSNKWAWFMMEQGCLVCNSSDAIYGMDKTKCVTEINSEFTPIYDYDNWITAVKDTGWKIFQYPDYSEQIAEITQRAETAEKALREACYRYLRLPKVEQGCGW